MALFFQLTSYRAYWKAEEGKGNFRLQYVQTPGRPGGGTTPDLDAESFAIVLDILRNERPVYVDHTTGSVLTGPEPPGEEET